MANNVIKRIWNQNTLVNIEALKGAIFQDEDGGHTFEISGVDNSGNAISLSGTVAGVFLRPDNTDVPITGSASGGIVSVTLPAECYDVSGRFGLTVFVTADSKKTCVYAAIGTVGRTSSGSVAPGTSADVVDLINQISAAVATIPASWSGLMADIAPTYSTSAAYPVGAYVYYNGDLYRCTTAITTGETWTAAHWTTAVLGNDVSDLKTAIGDLDDLTTEDKSDLVGAVNEVNSRFISGIETAVDDWLDGHPEATTTVQDGSLEEVKFANSLKLLTIKDYNTPQMFGASGDGMNDDTEYMTACCADCVSKDIPLVIPENTSILVTSNTLFSGVRRIVALGKIKAPNGVEFRYNSLQVGCDWYFDDVDGALTLSGLKDSFVTILKATSVKLYANSSLSGATSNAYNIFKLGYVPTLQITSENGGWNNDNTFIGGRITNLTVDGDYNHNNNHFYNNCFEGSTISFTKGRFNYIHNGRFENTSSVTFDGTASNNFVHCTYDDTNAQGIGRYQIPAWFHDTKGQNFFQYGGNPAVVIRQKLLTPYSYNYDTSRAYPNNDGTLHTVKNSGAILETNYVPIEHVVGVVAHSDQTWFRMVIFIYDANGTQITTQPSTSPFNGISPTWNNSGFYTLTSTNYNNLRFVASRFNMQTGVDSGVYYCGFYIRCGSNNVDIKQFEFDIVTPPYVVFDAFKRKEDFLSGSSAPASGTWNDGQIVYNTDSTNSCLGWVYFDSAWHKIGEYT